MTPSSKCIWCSQEPSPTTTFNKRAHTVPQSLGGQQVCPNVCDACNHYFGNYHDQVPPVETAIKEAFVIARYRFLNGEHIGKNQPMARFKSTYFDVNAPTRTLKLKSKFLLKRSFQETLGRQFKRGIYKMYLEEVERQFGEGHAPRYDFMRQFARYDQGDLPVYYFHRRLGGFLMLKEWAKYPVLLLREHKPMQYLVEAPGFDEVEFLGHVMGIATTPYHPAGFTAYIEKSVAEKSQLFIAWGEIKKFTDVDVALSILDT